MSTPSDNAPGYDLACPEHHPRTYRQCGCPFPAAPIKPKMQDTCRWCCTLTYKACGNREHWCLINEEYDDADLAWRRMYQELDPQPRVVTDEPDGGPRTSAPRPVQTRVIEEPAFEDEVPELVTESVSAGNGAAPVPRAQEPKSLEPSTGPQAAEPDDPNSPQAIAEHLAKTKAALEEARQHPERGLTAEEQAWFRQRFGPRLLPVPSQVPPQLINLKRWCCWKRVWNEAKQKDTKPPFSPVTGEAIGATQKYVDHLVDFETARAAVKRFKLDGLSFVFLKEDGWVGIDIDGGVTAKRIDEGRTELVIHDKVGPWLKQWFSITYQEYSPSRTGVHIICQGQIPKALTATPLPGAPGITVEMYAWDRHLTFTGHRIGVSLEITDAQISIGKLLEHVTGGKRPTSEPVPEKPHAMTVAQARLLYEDKCEALRNAKEGEGNALLNKVAFFAGQAFAAGALKQTQEQLKTELLNVVTQEWRSPHPETGARATIDSGFETGIEQPLAIITACTDLGNAERFVLKHARLVRWVSAYGDKMGWYVWDGHRWKTDGRRQVQRLAHETVRAIYQEAARAENDDDRKRLAAWAVKSENSRNITALLNEAHPYLAVEPRELDADPELLNLENGTLDLRTGEVREQRPSDLITRLLPVRYEANASCPLFEKHLALVLPDEAVRAYFQEMIAYHLSGSTGEQCIHILYGDGENGKSTTIDLFRNLAGDYGWPAPRALFAGGYQDIAPHQIADLFGRRFVTCSEFKNGDVLRVEVMKTLTSGESAELNGCRKYGHAFSFRPQAKFILDSNYLLEVDSPDLGTWRRIRLIAFNQTISQKVKKDIHFDKRLWAERSGILNWVIAGLKRWNQRERKLIVPEAITKESKRYEKEQDLLEQFIIEQCDRNSKASTDLSRFTAHYQDWLKGRGSLKRNDWLGKRALKDRLIKKGHAIEHDTRERCDKVQGLALRALFGEPVI